MIARQATYVRPSVVASRRQARRRFNLLLATSSRGSVDDTITLAIMIKATSKVLELWNFNIITDAKVVEKGLSRRPCGRFRQSCTIASFAFLMELG